MMKPNPQDGIRTGKVLVICTPSVTYEVLAESSRTVIVVTAS
jgi:hypothetical protein